MPRGDQISRQWQILQILEARRMGVSVPDLANELEAKLRTIYRDIEALEMAGFPLYSEKKDGVESWFFVEGYSAKIPVPFELTEIMALSLARDHLKAFEGTVFSESMMHAFDKVKAMLKPEAHTFLEELGQKFRVGLKGTKDYRKHRETIEVINLAVMGHRTLIAKYRSGKGETIERRIDPYHVWFMSGTIYVVGFCHKRKQLRLFVLERIERAYLTDDQFNVPDDFSMEEFTKGRFRVMAGTPTEVKIRFNEKVAYYVKERMWHSTQEIVEEAGDSIVLSMTVEGLAEVKSWVMSFGSLAEVLSPKELRDEVFSEFTDASKLYRVK